MPKIRSRIWLEITNIRVERLDDINKDDAINEGVEVVFNNILRKNQFKDYLGEFPDYNNPINSFKSLWRLINGKDSYDLNPYVWVVEFKRVNK